MKREFTIKLEETTYKNGNHLVTAWLYDEKNKELRTSAVSKTCDETYSFKHATTTVIDLLMSNTVFDNDDNDIEEGDCVMVKSVGKSYTTYTEWVGKHISSELAAHYVYGYTPNIDKVYKVIKRVENMLYIAETFTYCNMDRIARCYLMHIDGVQKVYEV